LLWQRGPGHFAELDALRCGEADGSAVGRAQQFTGLFSRTGCENRADRVDDVASGLDAEGRGNDGLSGGAVADRPASPRQRIGARRAEDCATHATARFQRGVCGLTMASTVMVVMSP